MPVGADQGGVETVGLGGGEGADEAPTGLGGGGV